MKPVFDRQFFGALLILLVVTGLAYTPVFTAEFVNYDDRDYVTQNTHVQGGFTWQGVKWAFTTDLMGSWHPVTWLSHMLDVQLFGLNPSSHHAVNLGLHLLNVALLLALLLQLTGTLWPSALAAGLFAVHPLHVESVAWIAERKDVLSAFFGLLALLAYVRHVRALAAAPSPGGFVRSSAYWLMVLLLTLGLLSKPMLVTWPVVMLLLDWWPLRRVSDLSSLFHFRSAKAIWLEKLPVFALVAVISGLTLMTQHRSEAVMSFSEMSLASRLANTLHSLFVYVFQFVWPSKLAPFYPFNASIGLGWLALAALVVIGLSVLAIATRRTRPHVTFGWLWYLLVLFPVSGVVQAGLQAHADRYTYLPAIGLGVALAFAVQRWLDDRVSLRSPVFLGVLAVVGILAWRTHEQAALWQNSEKLFRHALAVTENNFMAHQGLAEALVEQGRMTEAKPHFETALRLYPKLPSARNNLAVILNGEGWHAEALELVDQVLVERPDFGIAVFNRGDVLERLGRPAEALESYRRFYELTSGDREAALRIIRLQLSLQSPQGLEPILASQAGSSSNSPADELMIGSAYQMVGNLAGTLAAFERGLQRAPQSPEFLNNLAWLLASCPDATIRNGTRAVALAEKAVSVTQQQQPFFIGTLAAAYAEAGRFPEAIATAQKAIDLANAAKQPQLAARNAELLELYRAGKPYHEPAK